MASESANFTSMFVCFFPILRFTTLTDSSNKRKRIRSIVARGRFWGATKYLWGMRGKRGGGGGGGGGGDVGGCY